MTKKKWIKKAISRPGALRKKAKAAGALGDKISKGWLKREQSALTKQSKGKGKLTPEQLRTLRQINLAIKLGTFPKRGRK